MSDGKFIIILLTFHAIVPLHDCQSLTCKTHLKRTGTITNTLVGIGQYPIGKLPRISLVILNIEVNVL